MDDTSKNNPQQTHLITCIVQRGKGDEIAAAALDAGAGGATTHFARGTGTRQRLGRLGLAIVPEKEVVLVICKAEDSSRIFDAIAKTGQLDVPGMGTAYITPVLRVVGGSI